MAVEIPREHLVEDQRHLWKKRDIESDRINVGPYTGLQCNFISRKKTRLNVTCLIIYELTCIIILLQHGAEADNIRALQITVSRSAFL